MSAETTTAAPPAAPRAAPAFAESLDADGRLRLAWEPLRAVFDRLGVEELAARAENARRILGEHGVSCFAPDAHGGRDEPWRLDLTPLLIPADEWREVEAGIRQRARLFNLILADLYGTQRLVRDGFVPAALVFANPGYLRPCQAADVPGGVHLHSYAADLARGPDGRWWVVADRTQAPTGLGFALENRSVLARVLPEAFQAMQPRPVADTLRIRRDALRRLAASDSDNPSLVLLTPGPRHEAYFEHTYLARLLGVTLVEGDDLTVRDRRLFIKTLDGLRRADVVIRRVSDSYCDPLELRSDSLLGVPGLVEAARAGHVQLANALGTGLLESPAFLPFLPGLCRHLLEEELRLPSLATWWCGQAGEQNHVRNSLDQLALRPAFHLAGRALRPAELDARERAALLENLRLRPHEYVGQEEILLSHAPGWSTAARTDHPVVWRVLALHDGGQFTVMPGGLARVHGDSRLASGSVPLTGLSKDVWVLPDRAATAPPIQVVTLPSPALERAPSDLPSRTADNLFWLGRYTERLEQLVRTCRCVVGRLSDDPSQGSEARLEALGGALLRGGIIPRRDPATVSREALQKEMLLLLFHDGHPSGVRDLLQRIHLAAFSVRDRLSADTWRILNRLGPDARQRPGRLPLVQASSTLHTLVFDLAALAGMEMENMTRGHGWVFLDLGRRLERGFFLARLMASFLRPGPGAELLWDPALEICDSVMTHRRRYFAEPRLASVLEVLIQDPINPRALAFQLDRIADHAAELPTGANPEGVARLREQARLLVARQRGFAPAPAHATDSTMPGGAGAGFLEEQAAGLAAFSELLTEVFFSHVSPQVS